MQSKFKSVTLQTCLFSHCENAETGTLLIATDNNKSCQISITDGKVIGASMGRVKGHEVADELLHLGIKSARFTKNMNFPHTSEALINSSERFLSKIGYATEVEKAVA